MGRGRPRSASKVWLETSNTSHLGRYNKKHPPRYPCSDDSCEKLFTCKAHALRHYKAIHSQIRHPCPSVQCEKTYADLQTARKHHLREHLGISQRTPCLHEGCTKTFFAPGDARKHYRSVHEGRCLPCPGSETFGCKSTFTEQSSAETHYQSIHTQSKTACLFRDRTGCNATFTHESAVKNHVKRLHTPRWICPLANCRNTVSEQGISNGQIDQHMAKHSRYGHLAGLIDTYPVRQSVLPAHVTEHRDRLKELLSACTSPNLQAEGEDPEEEIHELGQDEDSEAEIDELCEDKFDIEKLVALSTASEDLFTPQGKLSVQAEALLKRNLKIASRFPTKLEYSNNGMQCIGPGFAVDGLISEYCPKKAVISFETARLTMRRTETSSFYPNGHPILLSRCISCDSQLQLNRFLLLNGLHKAAGQKLCSFRSCLEPIWSTSRYCGTHLRSQQSNHRTLPALETHFDAAISRKWKCSLEMQRTFGAYKAVTCSKSPSGGFIFLDLEYDVTSHRIYEVGICDARGNTIVDCFTSLSNEEMERTATTIIGRPYPRKFNIINKTAAKQRNHKHGTWDIHHLAKHLTEAGITPETIVVVWATNFLDLSMLREWFEAEGYSGILPPDANCIGLVRPFRMNLGKLSDGTAFPIRLPILFPLFYSTRHELFGRNHHAFVDALQTRLMFLSFVGLCELDPDMPVGWKRSMEPSQRSLLDYFSLSSPQ